MRNALHLVIASAASLIHVVPAYAANSTALPEPGALTLLAIGIAGVLIGRRFAHKPPRD